MATDIPVKQSVIPLPIFTYFNRQRFTQMGCMDCANWYNVGVPDTKNGQAMYPAMGRKHFEKFGENKLIFDSEPKAIFRTINYFYIISGTTVFQADKFLNLRTIGSVPLGTKNWFAYLPVGNVTYAMLTAETAIYVITENGTSVTMQLVTDTNAPTKPLYVASFGDRFVVSNKDTPDFFLSQVNLGGVFDPATCFTIPGVGRVFARASGIIGQMGVLHNQLYIFCSFSTDVWANIQTVLPNNVTFPWKKNTSYNFDYGIADPDSLDIDFGIMTWLANNQNGLVSFMSSNGQQPIDISSQAVNVLIEGSINDDGLSPFISGSAEGFLFQYENTIFYRVSAGKYMDFGILDVQDSANSIEYNFDTKTWCRVIELNGERNRIQKHIYFDNNHIVTVEGDTALYKMSGNIYTNELRDPTVPAQDPKAFKKYPMRYELTTQQIFCPDYSEFITDYVEIDFVFGYKTFYKSDAPFDNTIFIIKEEAAPDGTPIFTIAEDVAPDGSSPVFLIMEEGNTPGPDDDHYNTLFKPHIELYTSDDGGMTFFATNEDVREFSPLGKYQWRMRWYELGASRNRAYKLVCVSPAPIVILGAVQSVRRASGGAN